MSKLKESDWTSYRALLSKYDRSQDEFRLDEQYLHQPADGILEGLLWLIHVQTDRGVAFHFDKFRSNWAGFVREAFAAGRISS
jgi:hypothetical protein